MSTLRRSQWPTLRTNLQSSVEIRPPDLVQPDFLRHRLFPVAQKVLICFEVIGDTIADGDVGWAIMDHWKVHVISTNRVAQFVGPPGPMDHSS